MATAPILVVCLNPTFQKTLLFERLGKGEVNRCKAHRQDASGKGVNVARIIGQLGSHAIHLTHLGGPRRDEMLALLACEGIETVWADSGSPVRTCTTVIDASDGSTTELVEESSPVAPSTERTVRDLFSLHVRQCGTLVISGTRAPGYSDRLYADFVRQAKELGLNIVLDVKGHDLTSCLPFGPDIVKPNLSEFTATFLPGRAVGEQEDSASLEKEIESEMASIHQRYGTAVLLTRGARAAWLYTKEGFSSVGIPPAKVVNTIGCGDAVTAGVAWSLCYGKTIHEAVAEGLRCAALKASCLRPGSLHD